ncbi:DNA/RNA helicase domain-containing protein [Psychroserpens sp. MEBiC05023]
MSLSFELSIEVSEQYDFNKETLKKIQENTWVKNKWPLVYFIQNEVTKIAYVGESTNATSRIKNHLANPKKSNLKKISIIGSDKFNKSATLDIESKLIQYISSEGTYKLQNGNYGLINHNYYQQDLYKNLFRVVWDKLLEKRIISKSLEEIENTELFKYSPYKTLNEDQYNSVIQILDALVINESNMIFVKGSAGTGKTILSTYFIKLLNSEESDYDLEDLNENEVHEINLIKEFSDKYPNKKIGLVIAMTSLRETLKKVFRKVPGLKASMVISPSDTFNEYYDLLIVDEAHRLRQYKNISWRGTFKKNNQKLGLDDKGNELDWILANSKNQILFYDSKQSVKPSDISQNYFDNLLANPKTSIIELKSQMRVAGGNDYISFVDKLLEVQLNKNHFYKPNNYDLKVFDSLKDLYEELTRKEEVLGLCRLIAGYSWEWRSDPKKNPHLKDAIDIEIDGLKFQWNKTHKDWINSPNSFQQIGCIHTCQGYDLNYTGVIFGKEIKYNNTTNTIEIDANNYFDKYGRIGVESIEDLKSYIINIYKTIMYRGIKGTYIYACDKNLREYFKKHILSFEKELKFRIIEEKNVIPYVNSVPLLDLKVAAGEFSDLQLISDYKWIELPEHISAKEDYFVCKIVGESMNKIIPNGSYCLFKKDPGGTRNGKTVIVQHHKIQDKDYGSGFTIKYYQSTKTVDEKGWHHKSITLSPKSNNESFKDIILLEEDLEELKVFGVFVSII